jgi:hypothetical protein
MPQFNFTGNNFLDQTIAIRRDSQSRNIIQSLQTGLDSAANGLATAIPGAISQVQSAVSSAATSIPNSIEAVIPKNCSIGTKQFCVGLSSGISCKDLPLNLSMVIPDEVANILHVKVDGIQPLNEVLKRVTTAKIQGSIILGLLLVASGAALSLFFSLGRFFCLAALLTKFRFLRVGIMLVYGTTCCVPFLVITVILYILKSKTDQLPSWINVEQGEVSEICLGGLVCAVAIAALGSVVALL